MPIVLNLIVGPTVEPVSLALVKEKCHAGDYEDATFTLAISAVREQAEHILGRALVTQTWERVLDCFPSGGAIELFNPRIQSIVSVKYISTAGTEVTLASNQYVLDKDGEPGWIAPAFGVDWPETYDTVNAVRVRYISGYDNDGATVPANIKFAILVGVQEMMENGGEFCPSGAFMNLLQPARLNLGI